MKNEDLFSPDHEATYCPEDDKLRLYVGRVPREEYEALRSEGWTSTPKQECDFAAVWTPSREDTALSYAGTIGDEDTPPTERAADRAERFAGYRDKRTDEAVTHADRYDSGPAAHGYQSKAKAARAADRHDRIASRAVNAWDKAEYWTRRTAGVIQNSLYKSRPDVRMGRIKRLESEIRNIEANYTPHKDNPADGGRAYGYDEPHTMVGQGRAVRMVKTSNLPKIREACARELKHLRLRLAYEEQMLEAQGGRAAAVEMEKGGTFQGATIAKVNKSPKTGRVVSVAVIVPRVESWAYKVKNTPGTPYALATFETERAAPSDYSPPTDASRAKLADYLAAVKAAKDKRKATAPPKPKLVNPTREDAQRLQDLLNANHRAAWEREHKTTVENAPSYYTPPKSAAVLEMTQAEYSAASKGSYARAGVHALHGGAVEPWGGYMTQEIATVDAMRKGPLVCKVRLAGYEPRRVIHLTDKPAKPLPAALFTPYTPLAECTPDGLAPRAAELVRVVNKRHNLTDDEKHLVRCARVAELVGTRYGSASMTDEGDKWARALGAYDTPTPAAETANVNANA